MSVFEGKADIAAELLSNDEALAVGINFPRAIAGGLIYLTKIKVFSSHQSLSFSVRNWV
jgi:hypothetical protein